MTYIYVMSNSLRDFVKDLKVKKKVNYIQELFMANLQIAGISSTLLEEDPCLLYIFCFSPLPNCGRV